MSTSLDDKYPLDCPFCKIAHAYPADPTSPVPSAPNAEAVDPQCHLILSTPHALAFLDILPMAPGHILLTTRRHYEKVSDLYPSPIAASSSSETTEDGRSRSRTGQKQDWLSQRERAEALASAQAIGEWLPLVSRALCAATGVEDWNVVQNNGARAAQVVPHVHFHLIPRYQEGRREKMSKGRPDVATFKSWTMFGRGAREDLDDEEGKSIAEGLRRALRSVLDGEKGTGVGSKL